MHTLKQSLHTLCKSAEYQIDNMFVYAVYAIIRIFFKCCNVCLFKEQHIVNEYLHFCIQRRR